MDVSRRIRVLGDTRVVALRLRTADEAGAGDDDPGGGTIDPGELGDIGGTISPGELGFTGGEIHPGELAVIGREPLNLASYLMDDLAEAIKVEADPSQPFAELSITVPQSVASVVIVPDEFLRALDQWSGSNRSEHVVDLVHWGIRIGSEDG